MNSSTTRRLLLTALMAAPTILVLQGGLADTAQAQSTKKCASTKCATTKVEQTKKAPVIKKQPTRAKWNEKGKKVGWA